jgi:hypothetical protein
MTTTRTTVQVNPVLKNLIAAIAASVLLFFGYHFYAKSADLVNHGSRTEGTVVDFVQKQGKDSDGNSQTYYYSVFEFPVAGKPYRVTSQVGSNKASHMRGEKVKVLYPPNTPEGAIIEEWIELWFVPAVLLGLGGLCAFAVVWSVMKLLVVIGLWAFYRNKA